MCRSNINCNSRTNPQEQIPKLKICFFESHFLNQSFAGISGILREACILTTISARDSDKSVTFLFSQLIYSLKNHVIRVTMHKTFREFNGKMYMLDELSYFGLEKSDAEKRKAMLKKSGLGVRCIKKANGKYVVYREYSGDINKEDGSSFFE